MASITNNLTFYRKKNGLTQGQLGELLHVSAQAISKWENGQAEPSIEMILKLAEIYHITTDELLGANAPASEDGSRGTAAIEEMKKPSGFVRLLRKFWYVPVALLLLAAVAISLILYLTSPARYGRMIKNGEIATGMTQSEIKELLDAPTDTAIEGEYESIFINSSLNYKDAEYYVYYDERPSENEEELWFGVKYEYLRLVFDEDRLVEAFYNATPQADIWGYGETKHLTVASFEEVLLPNGRATGYAIVTFSNGSVYLGAFSYKETGDPYTGVIDVDESILIIAMGTYTLPNAKTK